MSVQKITPFLWYNHNAEEAIAYYCTVFKDAEVLGKNYHGGNGPLFSATIRLAGQELMIMNFASPFQFTEAISLFITCETQEDIDELWEKLSAGGEQSRCGWLKDKFGLSWQVIPTALMQLTNNSDKEKAQRVFQAMMQMDKIIIADLEKAYEGN